MFLLADTTASLNTFT